MSLKWEGDKVIKNVDAAIIAGMAQTISNSVVHAKRNHTWKNRSGTLEGSIREVTHPHKEGTEFVGIWGSVDVDYALLMELGADIVRNQLFGRFVSSYTAHYPPRPYLRPAADSEYPKLSKNIRRALEGKRTSVRHESLTLGSGREIEVFRPI